MFTNGIFVNTVLPANGWYTSFSILPNWRPLTLIKISLKPVPKDPIGNKFVMVQVMAWYRRGGKPLPEAALTQLTDTYVFVVVNLCSGAGKRYSNRKETSCVPLLNAGFEPGDPETKSPADWMLADKPTELSRSKLKNLNSTARPYDQRAFSPLDPTVSWLSHLALAIYIFVVVNFDALA